jgi:enoyl-CoA hydratase/carnithine racemase
VSEALARAAGDDAIHCVILSGAGDVFSAGGNLQRLQANRSKDRSVQADSIDRLNRCTAAIRTCPKPVIAAVEGFAAGAAFSIALACDFIIASDNAKFVMAYIRVALTPDGGGAWELVRTLPKALVSEALLNGTALDARRLATLGLVNQTVSPGAALDTAALLARAMASLSPNALRLTKQLISKAQTQGQAEYLESEKANFIEALHHNDGGEGIAAFLDKRPATYGPDARGVVR